MIRFRNIIVRVWLLAIMLTSCVSNKPIASSVGAPDYNQRIIVYDPQYKKKHNAIGLVFDVSAPIAGAVAGYSYNPFVRQTEEGQKSVPAGGVALGSLVGLGAAYASHAIWRYGNIVSVKNEREWIKKAFGSNYYLLDSGNKWFKIINKNAEKNYTVKNLSDVSDFAKVFPASIYYEQVVEQALLTLNRDDMPHVLELFPQTANAQKLKDRYIKESPTYQQLIYALQKYPKQASEVEELFAKLVRTPMDALDFHQRYPFSSFDKKVIINAFQTDPIVNDVNKLKAAYGDTFYLSQSDLSNASDLVRRNYYVGVRDITNFTNMSQLDSFNEKYSWLTFKDKKYEIASKAWTLADRLYSKGGDVIAQVGNIVGKSYARNVGLDATYYSSFVNEMLKQQYDKVRVISTNAISSSSEEFERWRKSVYSAGIVRTDENLKFLVYGEIRNDSKYEFPVALRVYSDVYQVRTTERGGAFGRVINAFVPNSTSVQSMQLLGSLLSREYIIPCVLSGQTMPYAILIEVKDDSFNTTGINVIEMVKISWQVYLQNTTVRVEKCDKDATQEQLSEQNAWLQMAKNGLPDAKIVDMLRNQEYKQSTWDAQWSKILEDARKYASSSSSSTRRKKDYESNSDDDYESSSDGDDDLIVENHQSDIQIDIEEIEMPNYEWIDNEWKDIHDLFDDLLDAPTLWKQRNIRFSDREVGKSWISRHVDGNRYSICNGVEYTNLEDAIKAEYVYLKYGKERQTGKRSFW